MTGERERAGPLLPGFRWCLSTLGCAELDLSETIALAARHGIGELELRALEDRLDLPAYLAETFGEPARLRDRLAAAPVRVTVLDTSLRLIGNDARDREALLAFIPWAEALGVPWLRVFDGGELSDAPDRDSMREAVETVRWWQNLRRRNGWRTDLAMETHDAFCRAESCLALQDALPEPIAVLWDAHHTWHRGGEALEVTWPALRPFIRHIHFKDSVPEANEVNDYTCAVPGEGRFPLAAFFRMIGKDRFEGALCLEWERKWQPRIPDLATALAGLRRFQLESRNP